MRGVLTELQGTLTVHILPPTFVTGVSTDADGNMRHIVMQIPKLVLGSNRVGECAYLLRRRESRGANAPLPTAEAVLPRILSANDAWKEHAEAAAQWDRGSEWDTFTLVARGLGRAMLANGALAMHIAKQDRVQHESQSE